MHYYIHVIIQQCTITIQLSNIHPILCISVPWSQGDIALKLGRMFDNGAKLPEILVAEGLKENALLLICHFETIQNSMIKIQPCTFAFVYPEAEMIQPSNLVSEVSVTEALKANVLLIICHYTAILNSLAKTHLLTFTFVYPEAEVIQPSNLADWFGMRGKVASDFGGRQAKRECIINDMLLCNNQQFHGHNTPLHLHICVL